MSKPTVSLQVSWLQGRSANNLQGFGADLPNVGPWAPSTGKLIQFGSVDDLREAFERDADKIAAFMIEPIQGSAG
jgi:glutamate-1-semialdehyde aminotransferase